MEARSLLIRIRVYGHYYPLHETGGGEGGDERSGAGGWVWLHEVVLAFDVFVENGDVLVVFLVILATLEDFCFPRVSFVGATRR